MTAYYNEIDPFAAAWLRELIKAGHIAPGDVDERSIEDVRPTELAGYTQCHFFAGIGVWSYALRQAGVPDDYPVWTGSCPCQPFSAAGKGAGFADERHLWPAWFHLIQQCRPTAIFGEQVASKAADPWVDLVQADLEAMGYAFGCIPFPSAGVGAPHIRDRNFWVGHAERPRLEGHGGHGDHGHKPGRLGPQQGGSITPAGSTGRLADSDRQRFDGEQIRLQSRKSRQADPEVAGGSGACGVADADSRQRDGLAVFRGAERDRQDAGREKGGRQPWACCEDDNPGPLNGFWADADWLLCRDGKWRPVEPGTFPLVDGAPARVVRLRGYGNAINAVAAQIFIEAVMEAA